MPAEDLALPTLDLRALARRAAVPVAAAAAVVAALLVLGGPLHTFADAMRRALAADPVWVGAAAGFELLSFGGYILLLWLVGSRVSARRVSMPERRSAHSVIAAPDSASEPRKTA